jgi:hypothetical protein
MAKGDGAKSAVLRNTIGEVRDASIRHDSEQTAAPDGLVVGVCRDDQ